VTHDRWTELLGKLFEGTITAEEHAELRERAAKDPALAHELEGLLGAEPFLVDALRGDEEGEGFVGSVLHALEPGDDTSFVRQVVKKAREDVPASRMRSTPWAFRQRKYGGGPHRIYWAAGAAAAGLFLIVIFLAAGRFGERRDRVAANPGAEPPSTEAGSPSRPEKPSTDSRREAIEKAPEPDPSRAPVRTDAEKPSMPPRVDPAPAPPAEVAPRPPERRLDDARPKEARPTEVVRREPRAVGAKVEEVHGEAFVTAGGAKKPLSSGNEILEGDGVETGVAGGHVVLKFADGTRVELGPRGAIGELAGAGSRGKRVFVEAGTVRAEVAEQPKDHPMVFATPHGEATVLGTTLRLVVDPDPKVGTRLEVLEGKVRLKNLAGRTAEVTAGHSAVAAVGVTASPKALYLFGDDFDRGTLASWRQPKGRKVWRLVQDPGGPGFVLAGGTVSEAGVGRETLALLGGDPSWGDYALDAMVQFRRLDQLPSGLGDGVMLLGRMQDATNFYWLECAFVSGKQGVYICKMAGGKPVTLAGVTTDGMPDPDRWEHLRFELRGPTLRGYVNHRLKVETQDGDFRNGQVGLTRVHQVAGGNVIHWDKVRVCDLSAPRK